MAKSYNPILIFSNLSNNKILQINFPILKIQETQLKVQILPPIQAVSPNHIFASETIFIDEVDYNLMLNNKNIHNGESPSILTELPLTYSKNQSESIIIKIAEPEQIVNNSAIQVKYSGKQNDCSTISFHDKNKELLNIPGNYEFERFFKSSKLNSFKDFTIVCELEPRLDTNNFLIIAQADTYNSITEKSDESIIVNNITNCTGFCIDIDVEIPDVVSKDDIPHYIWVIIVSILTLIIIPIVKKIKKSKNNSG